MAHLANDDLLCRDCTPPKYFLSQDAFRRHRIRHQDPRACHICEAEFATSSDLKRHQNTHLKDQYSAPGFSCSICGQKLSRKEHLRRHLRTKHQWDEKALKAVHTRSRIYAQRQPINLEQDADSETKLKIKLFYAARSVQTDDLDQLLSEGRLTEATYAQQRTLLHVACRGGNLDNVKLLLGKGFSINTKDSYHMSALANAADKGHALVVEFLVENGAEVDQKALVCAASNGHEHVLRFFLERSAFHERAEQILQEALKGAAASGHEQIVALLLEKGAVVESEHGRLELLIEAAKNGHEAVVSLLLAKGANMLCAETMRLAILGAIWKEHPKVVLILVAQQALRRDEAAYALDWASRRGYENIVTSLFDKSPNLVEDYGAKALARAIRKGHDDIVTLIFDRGSKRDSMDAFELRVLKWAVKAQNVAVIRRLLDRGVDMRSTHGRGHAIIFRALRRLELQEIRNPLRIGDLRGSKAKEMACRMARRAAILSLLRDILDENETVPENEIQLAEQHPGQP